ncbi:hypothetical protein ACOSQ4_012345 [Xanthoceras sorbifolium]
MVDLGVSLDDGNTGVSSDVGNTGVSFEVVEQVVVKVGKSHSLVKIREAGEDYAVVENVLLKGKEVETDRCSLVSDAETVIDSNSTGCVLGVSRVLDTGQISVEDSLRELSSVHSKGKTVEEGEVCSPKHRKWKKMARAKAGKSEMKISIGGNKRELVFKEDKGKESKRKLKMAIFGKELTYF